MPLFPRPVRGRTTIFHIAIILTLAVVFALSSLATYAVTHATGSAYVRVNQVGYIKGETKQAILMASGSESGASFKVFSGKGARYVDNAIDWPSVEPADDYTALSILVFAQQVTQS